MALRKRNSHKCRLKMVYLWWNEENRSNPMTIGKQKLCKTACMLHWPINGSMWCSDRYQISPSFPPLFALMGCPSQSRTTPKFYWPPHCWTCSIVSVQRFWFLSCWKFQICRVIVCHSANVQWICSEAQVESLYSPSNQHKNGAEHVRLKDYVPFGARPSFQVLC